MPTNMGNNPKLEKFSLSRFMFWLQCSTGKYLGTLGADGYIKKKVKHHEVSTTGLWFYPRHDPTSYFSWLPNDILYREIWPLLIPPYKEKFNKLVIEYEAHNLIAKQYFVPRPLRDITDRALNTWSNKMDFIVTLCRYNSVIGSSGAIPVLRHLFLDRIKKNSHPTRKYSDGFRGVRPCYLTIDQWNCYRAKALGRVVIEQLNEPNETKMIKMFPDGNFHIIDVPEIKAKKRRMAELEKEKEKLEKEKEELMKYPIHWRSKPLVNNAKKQKKN